VDKTTLLLPAKKARIVAVNKDYNQRVNRANGHTPFASLRAPLPAVLPHRSALRDP